MIRKYGRGILTGKGILISKSEIVLNEIRFFMGFLPFLSVLPEYR